MNVDELVERLRELDGDLPVAVDLEHLQIVPITDVVTYDIPAAVIIYDPEGAV